ncbi:unnamed protein product [Arabidopsis arenosa]|uniref:Uncharacterized protein n=1 Tax=Arabidopsis arenosa TaxID=38785 RepID=A0A8S2A6J9_ARAAE|nr:unnamed protein product [Arabidopsis arenosa]
MDKKPFASVAKPLIEALIQEGDSNLQIGAALCLAASVEAATDPESEQLRKSLPKIGKLLKSDGFKAKAALLSDVGSIITAGGAGTKPVLDCEKRNEVSSADLFAGSLAGVYQPLLLTPVQSSHSSLIFFPGTLAGIQHKSDMFLLGICEVWPGPCVFPDYTNSKARSWWANLVKEFVSNGVDGIWNDMNEPAVFKVVTKTMPENNIHRRDDDLGGVQNHSYYHNVYGMLMARSTYEGMELADKNKRPFVLTRAGFIGSQRYAATWTGDNLSNWEHLHMSISMVLQLVRISGIC